MANQNEKILAELVKREGNSSCADCRRKNPEYASYNLGIFICTRCASTHRRLGTHISKVKHLKLDVWDDSTLQRMVEIGNVKARMIYEERVPKSYRIPKPDDPEILIEQWIRAKYERLEFSKNMPPSWTSGKMEGFLMKRKIQEDSYHPRKFILNESDDTLRYFVKEFGSPKAILRISDLNVVLSPQKIPYRNSMQLTYVTAANSTRHIYVYHEDPEIIIQFYNAIRSAKFNRLQVAFPNYNDFDTNMLTHDFAKEGWLYKTGPRKTDNYKKRWFTLDDRKLMYHEDKFDAFPKGEIFLGDSMHGYSIRVGPPDPHWKDQGFSFTLFTPERIFNLSSESSEDRDEWMEEIQKVLDRPLTPQDTSLSARLNRKRNSSFISFSGR